MDVQLKTPQAAGELQAPTYLSGFGNEFESEALAGALPVGRNSPQRCPYGLYAEQLSGAPFTAPRATNRRTWFYRIRPSVAHWGAFTQVEAETWRTGPSPAADTPFGPLRWDPLPIPAEPTTFLEGIRTITTAGEARNLSGMAAHVYVANRSMTDDYFYDADGELLFVPQMGALRLHTEAGVLDVAPGEIAVVPRGMKFRVVLLEGPARGYLCENYGALLTLPERGPIGANGLANPRDFLTPVAAYEDRSGPFRLYVRYGGKLWQAQIDRSPLDVVAWHGAYVPYKYDLQRFCPMGPVLFDHADPSIFTVLTSPSETLGTANLDFVIFPDRWMVAEDTFRPPWFHMNVMSEFMGLIRGQYDAKPEGFSPGGASLHNMMLPHGPDASAFAAATEADLKPVKLDGALAFMFETRLPQTVTPFAAASQTLQPSYVAYGATLASHFDKRQR